MSNKRVDTSDKCGIEIEGDAGDTKPTGAAYEPPPVDSAQAVLEFTETFIRLIDARPPENIWVEIRATMAAVPKETQRDTLTLLASRFLSGVLAKPGRLLFKKHEAVRVVRREAAGVDTKGFNGSIVEDRIDSVIVLDDRKHKHAVAPESVKIRSAQSDTESSMTTASAQSN